MFINISCKHPRVVKNMLAKYNCSGKCILMRADTVKANFYYPWEETLSQMAPINLFPNFKKKKYKKKKINMLFTELGRSVFGKKLCPWS